jgi:hypothetical protein
MLRFPDEKSMIDSDQIKKLKTKIKKKNQNRYELDIAFKCQTIPSIINLWISKLETV